MLRSSALACWRGAHLLRASTLRYGEEPLGAVELCWSPCAPRMLHARRCQRHPEVALRSAMPLCVPQSSRLLTVSDTPTRVPSTRLPLQRHSLHMMMPLLGMLCAESSSTSAQGRLLRSTRLRGGHRRRASSCSSHRHVSADDLRGQSAWRRTALRGTRSRPAVLLFPGFNFCSAAVQRRCWMLCWL